MTALSDIADTFMLWAERVLDACPLPVVIRSKVIQHKIKEESQMSSPFLVNSGNIDMSIPILANKLSDKGLKCKIFVMQSFYRAFKRFLLAVFEPSSNENSSFFENLDTSGIWRSNWISHRKLMSYKIDYTISGVKSRWATL